MLLKAWVINRSGEILDKIIISTFPYLERTPREIILDLYFRFIYYLYNYNYIFKLSFPRKEFTLRIIIEKYRYEFLRCEFFH